jgi:hypothetical protein
MKISFPLKYRTALVALLLGASSSTFANVAELFKAVQTNDLPALQKGLAKGFDVDSTDPRGFSLLMTASREGHVGIVSYLLRQKASVNRRNAVGETALMLAAFRGNLDVIKVLHKAGADVNHSGWAPLHYAAYEGHAAVCRYLIENDAEVEAKAPNGSTALMLASRQGHLEAVKVLLWEQANPNASNGDGATALSWALKYQHPEVAKLLRDAGARK